MSATLSDVALRAGVSVSAVSRVLANAPSTRVRQETRERIQQAAQELGYRPNFAGRALKTARSNVIAMVVPDVTNAIFSELMRGVEDGTIDHDYMVLLGRSEDMQPGGEMIAKLVGEGRVDGMLLQVGDETEREGVDALLRTNAPVVFINSIRDGHVGSVALPNEEAARRATEHLLALGHTRIAHAGGLPSVSTSISREAGYRSAMVDAGIEVPDTWVTHLGYTPAQGRAALRTLIDLDDRPTAVVVANLNAAIGLLAESRALGTRVPEDLSVVAIHDAWTAENSSPALTTVRMPLYELGRAAVDLLFAKLRGEQVGDVVVDDPGPELIARESTTAPPSGR